MMARKTFQSAEARYLKGGKNLQEHLPTNDLLFRKLMSSPDSQNILKAFVKDLLGLEFKTLTPKVPYYIDSYKKAYEEMEKMEIIYTEVDILATSEDGSHTTIECQVQSHQYFHERVIFYLGEAYRSPLGNITKKEALKKNNYASLRPAYGINIVNFEMFDPNENALQLFHLMNKDTQRPFLNKKGEELLVLCFFSLENTTIDKQAPIYHWQYYFKTGEVDPDAPDYIKEAKKKTDFLTLEEEEKDMIMKIDKAKSISDAIYVTAREEGKAAGRAEGKVEGREEAKQQLALNLLADNFTSKKISELTGLSIEYVEKLKNEKN